jgi:hypothetical protein
MTGSANASMSNGLLGATGFVGSALRRQTNFDACFHSRNVAEIEGQRFGALVCAAAPGSMLEANTAPERDRQQIHGLIERLSKVRAERFVLISSIAVLSDFAGQHVESTQDFQETLAYGQHRRELEAFVEDHFEHSLVVRLPALFGRGLRKNFIFDLLNPVPSMLNAEKLSALRGELSQELSDWVGHLYCEDTVTGLLKLDRTALCRDARRGALDAAVAELGFSSTQFHNRETTYQYYEIDQLWRDIHIASEAELSHLHCASEPLRAKAIHKRLTGQEMPETSARLHNENMHSEHAALWGKSGPYLYGAEETLERLDAFYAGERAPA